MVIAKKHSPRVVSKQRSGRNILQGKTGKELKLIIPKVKVHSLTGRITPALMRKAFQNVKRNRGAAGIDKESIKMFEANRQQNLDALMRQLKQRMFVPKPARRTYIPKGKDKFRPLGISVCP